MPKIQMIDPVTERAPGALAFPHIPLNAYRKSLLDESATYGKEAMIGMYEDMCLIREFEEMLHAIKTEGSYQGIAYDHKGPAHLSIGQESAAVGQAFLLDVDDHLYGSHRSHGEILAKGMSAIRKLGDHDLLDIMKTFMNGECLAVVEKGHDGSVRDLAIDFLVYGSLAEIFGRKAGFNRGLGGSMHAFFTPFGIYPNNALVGGSADIACGAALFKKVNRKRGMVIANIGDASMGCGPVWEALNFAAMGQFNNLWDEDMRGGLPIIFNFMNNFYGMGGQTAGETMAFDRLCRVAAGVNPEAMHAERVDGYNPLAVVDAIARKREVIEKRQGPVFLETMTYRYSGHSPSDASSYRDKDEIDRWREHDPLVSYARDLADNRLIDESGCEDIRARIRAIVTKACRLATDLTISPRLPAGDIERYMFSNRPATSLDTTRTPDVLIPLENNPRVHAIAKKVRSAVQDGKPVPKNKMYQLRDGIFEAIIDRFYKDPTLVAYGEENRDWGGAFACYRGLTEALPYHRLFNAPISEGAIVGTAVGYGLEGGRVIAELMYCDFMGRAGDEIFNQLAKWQSMSAGVLTMPVVLRVSVGSKYGAQHSQDWTALVNHIPGLKVAFPATPYDAKGMLNTALNGSDPVVFFESQRLYDIGEQFEQEVPEGYYEVPFGPPAKRRNGKDITLITIGATLYRAMEAADVLEQQYGLTADIFDCRSLNPLDYEPLVESIKKTGRVVLAGDACERGSIMQSIAANLTQLCFDHLDAPPAVVGSRNWITPCAEMENDFFPQPAWILDAIHEKIVPLPGHAVTTNQTPGELNRRNRLGV
ncbi:MAG TPA: thiamine pyrophosphate-dependent enzyme [Kiritimatiellia bacterium]|nr:thiamine pyrophosphate-dependent enzyme [Kiritimatiellia bacterium]HMO98339.1 thiamine pyrophosphate-dependent enzyme [Kiritimatiellia bacterium]HMP95465.1 thiamine pyrophosphate-dependent enzyme [Kiritimatiellia bacterium]